MFRKAVNLARAAVVRANSLISKGKIKTGSWSGPTATRENSKIEEDGWVEFGKWYLGRDPAFGDETKGHYKFPFSNDFENIHAGGVRAAITRAAQQDYTSIENAARTLYEKIKAKLEDEGRSLPAWDSHTLDGKTVTFEHEGTKIHALVDRDENLLHGRLAYPDETGLLVVTDNPVLLKREEVVIIERALAPKPEKIREFEIQSEFDVDKKFTELKNGEGRVVDFQDVRIDGYASTFQDTTPADRIGDYVLPGAFRATLPLYKKNPVVLIDHRNLTQNTAAIVEKIGEDKTGLYYQAKISNAPDLSWLRWRIVEKAVRATSIGGIFHYLDDNFGIERVDLYEFSIVPVPMNPDALFSARALDKASMAKFYKFLGQNRRAGIAQK
jgi:HK97 family phage prohead protease